MWKEAIEKLKRMFRENRRPEDWADNLMKASSQLKDPEDWKKFYSYITNPKEFDPNKYVKTLGDLEKIPTIPPYEDGMEVKTWTNGPMETKIHVRNTKYYNTTEDDEKKEEISTLSI